jgi:hypothetical protein
MPTRSAVLTSLTSGNQQHRKLLKTQRWACKSKDVPGEAAYSALEQKQRETAIAAATEQLRTLRRRNNPTICSNSFTTYAIPV